MRYIRVSISTEHEDIPNEMYNEITTNFEQVTRMVEVFCDGKVLFDDLKLHDTVETVFGVNSLIEGNFPDETQWTFDKSCFYKSITEFEFTSVFSQAV